MTREEAIAILDGFKHNPLFNEQHFEALDMAISALSAEGDLISRQAVLDELEKWDWQELYLPIHFKQILDDVPSAENKGEWIAQDIHNCHTDFKCSKCGYIHSFMHLYGKPTADYTYCPNCGADMREPKREKIRCNTCKNNDDEFSGECYECLKGIFDHYEPEGNGDWSIMNENGGIF